MAWEGFDDVVGVQSQRSPLPWRRLQFISFPLLSWQTERLVWSYAFDALDPNNGVVVGSPFLSDACARRSALATTIFGFHPNS